MRARMMMTLLVLGALSPCCTPESQILSGKWYSSGPVSLNPGEETEVEVDLEMVLGHFGPDVVGTIRLAHPADPMDCSCGPIVLGEYRAGGLFRFFVTEAVPCLSMAETSSNRFASPSDGLDLHIEVTLLDEELSGVVVLRYLEETVNTPIVFLRDETAPYISEEDKTCP